VIVRTLGLQGAALPVRPAVKKLTEKPPQPVGVDMVSEAYPRTIHSPTGRISQRD
jgi:hypothetical protein